MPKHWKWKDGRAVYARRVPTRLAELDTRGTVRIALGTADAAEATVRARAIDAELEAHWNALLAGQTADHAAFTAAARRLAAARGVVYRPLDAVLAGPLPDLVARLSRLAGSEHDPALVAAELGAPTAPLPRLSEALDFYFEKTADRLLDKTEVQVRRWRNPRHKAMKALIATIGDKPLDHVTRADALAFRDALATRIEADEIEPHAANKDLQHAAEILRTVERLRRDGLPDVLGGLRFKERETGPRLSLDAKAIRALLAPGALDGLNDEAADCLRIMVNTGCRPGEILLAVPGEWRLDGPVAHFAPGSTGRRLKTPNARRIVPLVGVSLEAARRRARTGFPRYTDPGAWSATVNKYLRDKRLLPSPRHTAYALRHGFEDRLTAAECPERISRDLMGHALTRERYGAGASLEHLAEWVARVAL